MKADSTTLIRETSAVALANYVVQLLNIIRGVFVAYFLGPAHYGLWNVIKTFLELAPLTGAGTGWAIALEVPLNQGRGQHAENTALRRNAWGLHVLAAGTISLLAMAFSTTTSADPYQLLIRLGALAFFLQALYLYALHELRSRNAFYLISKVLAASGILNVVLSIILLIAMGIVGLLLAMVITLAVVLGWLLYHEHLTRRPSCSGKVIRRLIGIGLPIMLAVVAPRLLTYIDRLLIYFFIGSTAAGYYSLAAFFSSVINYIPQAIAAVLAPKLMHQQGQGRNVQQSKLLYDKPLLLLSHSIPVVLGLITLNIEFCIHLLLPDYLPATPILEVLIFGLYFAVINIVPRGALIVLEKQRVFLRTVPLLLGVGTLFSAGAIWLGYGTLGVAYASVIFSALLSVVAHGFALSLLGRSFAAKRRLFTMAFWPFFYALPGLVLLNQVAWTSSALLDSAIRSALFLLYCLPVMLNLERRLSVLASLRKALRPKAT